MMGEQTTYPLPSWLRGVAARPWLVRGSAAAALAVLGSAAYLLHRTTAGCFGGHVAIQVAGSSASLEALTTECGLPDGLGPSLLADLLFIAGYWWSSTIVIAAYWPRYEAPLLRRATAGVVLLPAAVALLDLVENGLMFAFVEVGDGKPEYTSERAAVALGSVAWGKWSLVAVLAVVLVMAAAVGWSRRGEPAFGRPAAKTATAGRAARAAAPARTHGSGVLGVCLSGGGIRSASFSLGVLSVLEQRGLMKRARYLSAVSGGAWAATSWTLQRAFRPPSEPSDSAADQVIDRLKGASYGVPRRRYLLNGPGGWLLPLGWVLLCALVNLVLIAALVHALAWPVGKLLGSGYVSSELGATQQPGFYIGIVGLLAVVVSLASHRTAGLRPLAWGVVAIGVALLGLFWAAGTLPASNPAANIPAQSAITARFALIAGAFAVLAGGFGRLLTPLLTSLALPRLVKALPRVLGVVLLAGVLAWAAIVIYLVAVGTWSSWWVYGAWLAGLGIGYILSNPNSPSLHNIFRKRLQRSFDPSADHAALLSMQDGRHVTWPELRGKTRASAPGAPVDEERVPELVLCCAQQRNGLSAGGLPAESFTISPFRVRRGSDELDTVNYLATGCAGYAHFCTVGAWMATSGAAVSSAMGRASLGSTNAFLAAVNADLGMWLPNPALVARTPEPERKAVFRRPRFAYLLKEILGWYDCADRFVFVTDGGHWENLGLVELLHRGCTEIVCVDASGDAPGSFATLRQAFDLATLDVGGFRPPRDLDDDLAPLRASAGRLPGRLSTVLTAHYGDGCPVRIHYTKMQLDETVPPALRRFAIADPHFPGYSTARQMLSDKQLDALIDLGKHAGARLMDDVGELEGSVAARMTRLRIVISAYLTSGIGL
ncbi:DUF998 domain-containing protein [Nocardia asteroides]|uniref:DUF998 domain-containing protein n=1 Tax=Nocardia asteroides TaxID=1824 RepID=UPI001E3312AA|nr:DUF998 domain-containing protein [Nocardia asteroides]UGT62761.1 patatin-like phospholipase family protein [Nocardia asteroides]